VALWALGFVRASVQARTGGCGSGSSLTDVQTYRTYTSVQQALKKQIISVFEPMYLDVLNDNMVGFTNISARDMLDHLFSTYGNITAVDMENQL
jgi:hypothetical protein